MTIRDEDLYKYCKLLVDHLTTIGAAFDSLVEVFQTIKKFDKKNHTDLTLHHTFKKYFSLFSCLEVEYFWLQFNKRFDNVVGVYKLEYLFRKSNDPLFGDNYYLKKYDSIDIVKRVDKEKKTDYGNKFLNLYTSVDKSYINAKDDIKDAISFINNVCCSEAYIIRKHPQLISVLPNVEELRAVIKDDALLNYDNLSYDKCMIRFSKVRNLHNEKEQKQISLNTYSPAVNAENANPNNDKAANISVRKERNLKRSKPMEVSNGVTLFLTFYTFHDLYLLHNYLS
jgi:hypothetical protein